MRKPTKQQIIERLEGEVRVLRASAERFEEKLTEARRRTVPMGHGDEDINFLPLFVSKFKIDQNFREISSWSGERRMVAGRATAIITCQGDVVMSPNQSQPAKPAEPQIAKPPHDLGWKILNEFAESIKDNAKASCFISDCRVLEGGFTSGFISEAQYRLMLRSLLPK
jgi:hypothetical protein